MSVRHRDVTDNEGTALLLVSARQIEHCLQDLYAGVTVHIDSCGIVASVMISSVSDLSNSTEDTDAEPRAT